MGTRGHIMYRVSNHAKGSNVKNKPTILRKKKQTIGNFLLRQSRVVFINLSPCLQRWREDLPNGLTKKLVNPPEKMSPTKSLN